jgi:hypothetical protein
VPLFGGANEPASHPWHTHTKGEGQRKIKKLKSQSPHKVVKNSVIYSAAWNNSKYLNNRKTLHLDIIYSAADGPVVVERNL